jgi:hypothetical protein
LDYDAIFFFLLLLTNLLSGCSSQRMAVQVALPLIFSQNASMQKEALQYLEEIR